MAKGKKYVETDDWREALALLTLRACQIWRKTGETDQDTVPKLLTVYDAAHANGWKYSAEDTLAYFAAHDTGAEDLLAAIFSMEEAGQLSQSDFEAAFLQPDDLETDDWKEALHFMIRKLRAAQIEGSESRDARNLIEQLMERAELRGWKLTAHEMMIYFFRDKTDEEQIAQVIDELEASGLLTEADFDEVMS